MRASAETKRIRKAIWERSGGFCECGCGSELTFQTGEMDHIRGRIREAQKVSNCWFLIPPHHRQRTDNYPSAAAWWWRVAVWALKHQYGEEAEHAQLMIDKHLARGFV